MTNSSFQSRFEQSTALFNSPLLALLAIALLVLSYAYGINRGMQRVFAGPLDYTAGQVASAISDVAYKLDLKYAVHGTVLNTLTKGGLSDVPENYRPLGLKYPDYIADAALWDNLLERASHLQNITRVPRMSDGTLSFVQTEDLGMVDFFKLSFKLFGYNVEGFFKTYFLLLCLGIILLFAAFWSRPGILLTANLLLLGLLFWICQLSPFDSVANGRFFATLAIFPTLHLTMLAWEPPRPTIKNVILAAAQTLLLAFIMTTRSNPWGLALVGASLLIIILWKTRISWSGALQRIVVRIPITWPAVVVAAGVIGFNVYHASRIHPGYFALDETLPEHIFWHSMVLSLGYFPGIDSRVPGLNGVRGDGLPSRVGNAFLKRVLGFEPPSPSAYYVSEFFPNLGRQRTYERVLRAAYFDFAREHPNEFLRFTLMVKPRLLLRQLFAMSARVWGNAAGYLLLALLLVIGAVWLLRPAANDTADVKLGMMAMTAMMVASSVPYIIAYPAYLGETFAVWIGLIAGLLLWIAKWESWRRISWAAAPNNAAGLRTAVNTRSA